MSPFGALRLASLRHYMEAFIHVYASLCVLNKWVNADWELYIVISSLYADANWLISRIWCTHYVIKSILFVLTSSFFNSVVVTTSVADDSGVSSILVSLLSLSSLSLFGSISVPSFFSSLTTTVSSPWKNVIYNIQNDLTSKIHFSLSIN